MTIPDGVTSIGAEAFYYCSGLTSVTIPNGVTSIGADAFFGCRGLTSVTIPNSMTSIGYNAFSGCSGLTAVRIADLAAWCGISFGNASANPLYYAHNLYVNNALIKDLTIPDGVTSIGDYAFYGCDGITSVKIPDSVTSIGSSAFYGCSGIEDVTVSQFVLDQGIRNIFSSVYRSLTSVTIPDGVTSIVDSAFSGCSGITSVTVPSRWKLSTVFPDAYSGIKSVEVTTGSTGVASGAFKGCASLVDITIPASVTSIGDEAFYGCRSLEHLTIPEGVTSYGISCFEGCPAYTLQLYRSVFSSSGSGGGSASISTTIVQQVESPYALTNSAADRTIASVTVDDDCAIDSFVLKAGEVYDSVLRIVNTANRDVTLTLPSGYVYETFEGVNPLKIPANSTNILTITRTEASTFLVSREKLRTIQQ